MGGKAAIALGLVAGLLVGGLLVGAAVTLVPPPVPAPAATATPVTPSTAPQPSTAPEPSTVPDPPPSAAASRVGGGVVRVAAGGRVAVSSQGTSVGHLPRAAGAAPEVPADEAVPA